MISKMQDYPIFPKVARYWFSKIQDYPSSIKIPRSSKIIQDLLRFQDIDPLGQEIKMLTNQKLTKQQLEQTQTQKFDKSKAS